MKADTKLVHAGRGGQLDHGIVNTPVYHASTILFDSVADMDASNRDKSVRRMTYGRRGTPTLWALQDAFAELHGAHGALPCPSGVAALTTAFLAFLRAGDHALIADNVYGPTRGLARGLLARLGVATTFYDPGAGAAIEALIRPETRVIFLETPGSITLEVPDVPAIAAVARARGVHTILDNTWATPLFCKPLALGVDVVVESGTKFIAGHSDTNVGLIAATEAAWPTLLQIHGDTGQTLGPDDAYAALRGLRSLGVRLKAHEAAGMTLATWFAARPETRRVLYPALPGDAGHALWRRDFTGASGLFSVILEPCSRAALATMIDGLAHFGLGYSYGGFESLILPSNPRPDRTAKTWDEPGQLVRVFAGLEDPSDLIADLDAGLARLAKARAAGL